MIRHIVMARLGPGTSAAEIDAFESAVTELDVPGRLRFSFLRDLGLRAGNMDLAVITDLEDIESFVSYDQNTDHLRIRSEILGPIAVEVVRLQAYTPSEE